MKLDLNRLRIQAAPTFTLVLALSACSAGDEDTTTGTSTGNVKVGDAVDWNKDGQIDGTAVDVNADGIPDGIDTNGDGKPDIKLDGSPYPTGDAGGTPCVGQYCNDGGTPPPDSCSADFELKTTKTNVMFLVDGSNSMQMYWGAVKQAMADIINANPNLNFGVHMFHAEGSDLASFVRALNACGKILHPRKETATGQGQAIVDFMGGSPPGAGNAFFDRSPVLAGLNWYLENDSPMDDPESANYLIVFSDFVDTCFGTLFSNPGSVSSSAGSEQLLAFEKLAVELRKKNMKIIPIGFDGNPMNNSMGGAGGDVNEMALAALNTYGGTTVKKPLLATSQADVKKAIEEIGRAVQPCRFTVPAVTSGEISGYKVSFILNNQLVPRDRTKTEGWDFVQSKPDEVEFFGDACRALQAPGSKLQAQKNCNGDAVCGTAATQVSTRARALHILLDGSGSMQGGLNGWVGALFQGKLTPWGEATSAIAQMVTNPVNDDLEFGFQFFPASAEGMCADIRAPEVPIGQGNEITIIDELLSNVPNGTTPLVGALEYVAKNPGRLVEPDVQGTVLLISDGADSCAATNTRNQQLADAAASLYGKNAKTFAVKFDSGSSSVEQEDQLNTIALNGGTQKFLPALDGAALTEQLKMISGQLASCELRLGEIKDVTIDPQKVNLYLNGVAVPFDQAGAKMSGWGWTSDTSKGDFSSLELYGEYCDLLQKSRLNDINLELGCTIFTPE